MSFHMKLCLGLWGIFCGLGLGFVSNEMGEKIGTGSAGNSFPLEKAGTKKERSITEFGFPWDMCEAAISDNWIRDVPIYLRAGPLHVEFFKPHQLNSYLSCYRSDYFILIFPFVLRKHRAAAHWS